MRGLTTRQSSVTPQLQDRPAHKRDSGAAESTYTLPVMGGLLCCTPRFGGINSVQRMHRVLIVLVLVIGGCTTTELVDAHEAEIFERGCTSQIFAPDITGVDYASSSVTIGPVTFAGLTGGGSPGTERPDGRIPAAKTPTQIAAGDGPVWVVLTDPEASHLLYDTKSFGLSGLYDFDAGSVGVRFERCGNGYTSYNGGFLLKSTVCAEVAVYDGSLDATPAVGTVEFNQTC